MAHIQRECEEEDCVFLEVKSSFVIHVPPLHVIFSLTRQIQTRNIKTQTQGLFFLGLSLSIIWYYWFYIPTFWRLWNVFSQPTNNITNGSVIFKCFTNDVSQWSSKLCGCEMNPVWTCQKCLSTSYLLYYYIFMTLEFKAAFCCCSWLEVELILNCFVDDCD